MKWLLLSKSSLNFFTPFPLMLKIYFFFQPSRFLDLETFFNSPSIPDLRVK